MDRATRDRLKQQAAAQKSATQPAPPPQQPLAAPKPGASPARVICSCGHEDNNRPCGACRNAAHLAKVERNRAKREAAAGRRRNADEGRLPDEAEFAVKYCAATKTWGGKLTVDGRVFDGQVSGVFRLLKNLDEAYRASLTPGDAEKETSVAGGRP